MTKKQGRCWKCNKYFHWNGLPLVRDAICPYCGTDLQQTTQIVSKRLSIGRAHPKSHAKETKSIDGCRCGYCRLRRIAEEEKDEIEQSEIRQKIKILESDISVDPKTLQIIGYECLICTSPKNGLVICTDYKEHLRIKHKIPETHIPEILKGSPWQEDFAILYKTNKLCPKCDEVLRLSQFPSANMSRYEFAEYQCRNEMQKGRHHYHYRIFIGTNKLKNFCERHGHNHETRPCDFCNIEGSFSSLFS